MKKTIILLGLAISTALLLSACSAKDSNPTTSAPATSGAKNPGEYHKLTAEEAKKMLDEGDATIVDVRTADEYADKHIPGALLVPVESIGTEMPEALPDKDALLLIHCRTGVRSKHASEKLLELGYTNVYDFGGIVDWPYETESGEPQS